MTRDVRISPSQISRFRQCPRKTAFQLNTDLQGDVDPLARANDLGGACHEIAEAWLRDGTPPDPTVPVTYFRALKGPPPEGATAVLLDGKYHEAMTTYPGEIVRSGVHHLPAPKTPGLEVEQEVSFKSPTGITYAQRLDMTRPGWGGDHKFVGDLRYAKTDEPGSTNTYNEPNYLGDDPQAVLVATAIMVRDRLPHADLDWVYYQTQIKGGRYPTKRVHLRLTQEDVAGPLVGIEADAHRIQTIARLRVDPLALPPNTKGCKAFGRTCEHARACDLTPLQIYQGSMTTTPIDARIDAVLQQISQGQIGPTVLGGPPPIPSGPPPIPVAPQTTMAGPGWAPPAIPSGPPAIPHVPGIPALSGPPAIPALPGPVMLPPTPQAVTVLTQGAPLIHGFTREDWARLSEEDQAGVIAAASFKDPINPPEAPPNDGQTGPVMAPKAVAQVSIPEGGLEAMDRASLKAYAVQIGAVASSSRLGDVALRAEIRKAQGLTPTQETTPAPGTPGSTIQVTDLTPLRAALDAINAARAALLAAEQALHVAMGL